MRKRFLPLLALVALASCTQNDMDLKGSDEQAEIKLKSSTLSIDAVVSRAPFEGEITTGTNELTAKVFKSLSSGVYLTSTLTTIAGEMTFTDQGATAVGFNTTPLYYPVDGNPVYLCGLYPVEPIGENIPLVMGWQINSTGEIASAVIDGKTDIMVAPEVATTKTDASSGAYKTLAFEHLLTKLKIKAIADTTSQVTSTAAVKEWGKITKIELNEIIGETPFSQIKINMKTGVATYASNSGVKVYQMSDNDTYPATDVEFSELSVVIPELPAFPSTDVGANHVKDIAYSLIAPFTHTAAKKDIKLTVYTDKYTTGFPVSVDFTGIDSNSTVGKYCVVTLIFKASEIKAMATVTDWVAGGNADGTIE